jgi:glyceraldehyde-3-phosphate dehydrogenase (NADP+)
MTLSKTLFPTRSGIPPEFRFSPIQGRILINGQIIDSGFETKEVRSPCLVRQDVDKLHAPVLGSTAQVSVDVLIQALESAAAAWAKGDGRWPTAHMSARTEAVSAFRDEMLKLREPICRMLMWEIAKTWKDSLVEFDRTIQYIDDTLERVKQLDRDSSRILFNGGIMAQVRRAPLGVTL